MNSQRFELNRRAFVATLSGAFGIAMAPSLFANQVPRPRVAAIITEYRGYSHADVILGRFLQGYALSVQETYWPRTQVKSLFVDQFPKGDLSRGMAHQYGATITRSIEEALTMGTGELAVDGVLIIGEHGDYPFNEKGQHMYPRRRFFEETVKTFKRVGKSVPVFNDKHLGFAWEDAKWMYDQSREMKFPLMAGSSLPTTWRKPEFELPLGCNLEEALAVGYGGLEAYGFHALETLQCMVERRRGHETGVRAVTCLEGPAVWKSSEEGHWSRGLLDAALSRIKTARGVPEENAKQPAAILIEYRDGLKGSVLMMDGHANSFAFASKQVDRSTQQSQVDSTHFWLQEPNFAHFSYLTHNIESMFLTGKEIDPPERTLLTTGILDAVMTSKHEGNRRVETPWLEQVTYNSTDIARRAKF